MSGIFPALGGEKLCAGGRHYLLRCRFYTCVQLGQDGKITARSAFDNKLPIPSFNFAEFKVDSRSLIQIPSALGNLSPAAVQAVGNLQLEIVDIGVYVVSCCDGKIVEVLNFGSIHDKFLRVIGSDFFISSAVGRVHIRVCKAVYKIGPFIRLDSSGFLTVCRAFGVDIVLYQNVVSSADYVFRRFGNRPLAFIGTGYT